MSNMLYEICCRIIARKEISGLREKIDHLYAAGRLTANEYDDLVSRLEAVV